MAKWSSERLTRVQPLGYRKGIPLSTLPRSRPADLFFLLLRCVSRILTDLQTRHALCASCGPCLPSWEERAGEVGGR